MMLEEYNIKLKELYFVTGIPVALMDRENQFLLSFPKTGKEPHFDEHAKVINSLVDEKNIEILVPYINIVEKTAIYSIIRVEKKYSVLIGPVSTYEINYKKYINLMRRRYGDEQIQYHIRLLQGAPKVDINYFKDIIVLAMDLLCNVHISINSIRIDEDENISAEIEPSNRKMRPQVRNRSTISLDALQFNSEVYHMIEIGNLERLDELNSKSDILSDFHYHENDITKLRIVFITYAAIACRHAILGGVDTKYVQKRYNQYLFALGQYSSPEDMKKELPMLSRDLCTKVHELKNRPVGSGMINEATDYIKKHVYSKITVTELERELNVSRRTLHRHFVETLGMSPYEYITEEKLSEAVYLLEDTDMVIVDIAIALGYSSQSHFNKVFEKKYGCTPLQYRQANKNNRGNK